MRIAFVLRGRPGLGHVTPGFAVSQEVRRLGGEVLIATYANGSRFLRSSGYDGPAIDVPVAHEYTDWPGLDLYDDALSLVVPALEEFGVDVLVLGGEYLLAPLRHVLRAPTVMMYNPEIGEDTARNRAPARLFSALFSLCDGHVPLYSMDRPMLEEFASLPGTFPVSGPFGLVQSPSPETPQRDGRKVVLIANGGGVDFPSTLRSYSSLRPTPAEWRDQTEAMTTDILLAVATCLGAGDRIHAFSCLSDEENDRMSSRVRGVSDAAIEVSPPSLKYYQILREADVFITRAGSGALADAWGTGASVVVWALKYHDEQWVNAGDLHRRRPNTFVLHSSAEIASTVEAALSGARREPSSRWDSTVSTQRLARDLLAVADPRSKGHFEKRL